MMFAKYFEYYTIILRGAVFLWTRCNFVSLYKSIVRTHVEYANSVWCLFKTGDIQECGPMPNVMSALQNIGGAFCSMPQSLADARY